MMPELPLGFLELAQIHTQKMPTGAEEGRRNVLMALLKLNESLKVLDSSSEFY